MFRSSKAFLGVLACLVVFLGGGCSGSESAQEETKTPAQPTAVGTEPQEGGASTQPNIIFVLTDDLDYASAYKMPEISSSLLEEGASFDNAFTSQSLCGPSRATSLTGLFTPTATA